MLVLLFGNRVSIVIDCWELGVQDREVVAGWRRSVRSRSVYKLSEVLKCQNLSEIVVSQQFAGFAWIFRVFICASSAYFDLIDACLVSGLDFRAIPTNRKGIISSMELWSCLPWCIFSVLKRTELISSRYSSLSQAIARTEYARA